jgi:hypothetical protein
MFLRNVGWILTDHTNWLSHDIWEDVRKTATGPGRFCNEWRHHMNWLLTHFHSFGSWSTELSSGKSRTLLTSMGTDLKPPILKTN